MYCDHYPESGVPALPPTTPATDTKEMWWNFYLRGADRRSRHSDSLALGKQAGRRGGRRTHAQGRTHTHARAHTHTHTEAGIHKHTMPKQGGKENRHIAEGENAAGRKNAALPC